MHVRYLSIAKDGTVASLDEETYFPMEWFGRFALFVFGKKQSVLVLLSTW
jgi:hypothetical protein